jgi:hypothetical protein
MPYVSKANHLQAVEEQTPYVTRASKARWPEKPHPDAVFQDDIGVWKVGHTYLYPYEGTGLRLRDPEKLSQAMEIMRRDPDISASKLAKEIHVSVPTAYKWIYKISSLPEFKSRLYNSQPTNPKHKPPPTNISQFARHVDELKSLDPSILKGSAEIRRGMRMGLDIAIKLAERRLHDNSQWL